MVVGVAGSLHGGSPPKKYSVGGNRELKIDFNGSTYRWFDLDANNISNIIDMEVLQTYCTEYFGVPLANQIIFDDEGPVEEFGKSKWFIINFIIICNFSIQFIKFKTRFEFSEREYCFAVEAIYVSNLNLDEVGTTTDLRRSLRRMDPFLFLRDASTLDPPILYSFWQKVAQIQVELSDLRKRAPRVNDLNLPNPEPTAPAATGSQQPMPSNPNIVHGEAFLGSWHPGQQPQGSSAYVFNF